MNVCNQQFVKSFSLLSLIYFIYCYYRIGEILHHQGLQCSWPQSTSRKYPHNDIEERFESIVEANDMLLERIVS